jgi:hypothetical protein
MKRTTIMADEQLLDELRAIARREGLSLAEVMREGLQWRVRQGARRRLSFIASGSDPDGPSDIAERAHELPYEPRSWR